MATICTYRCDKCGKKGCDPADYKKIKAYTIDGENSFIVNCIRSMDVCRKCYDGIFSQESENGRNEETR